MVKRLPRVRRKSSRPWLDPEAAAVAELQGDGIVS
jgi:hypothetical protein